MSSLEEKREKAIALIDDGKFAMRSCHECNTAHEYFTHDEDCVILCFACGRYWLGAYDLTEHDTDA